MPPLENRRHELFAQGLAKGLSATEAYSRAGYAEHAPSASRLLTNAKVTARVSELQERCAIRVEVTVESLMAELDECKLEAIKLGQISAAVSAIKEKGVLSGVRVEKRETLNKRDPQQMSDAEILDAIRSDIASGAIAATSGQIKPH